MNKFNPTGAVDLSGIAQRQHEMQSQTNQLIITVAQGVFAQLVAVHVDVPAAGQPYDHDSLRRCASFSIEAAKYFAEAVGLVKIEIPTSGDSEKVAEVTTETHESNGAGHNGEAANDSPIIVL